MMLICLGVVRRMGITFAVDRKRVAIDAMLSRIHSEYYVPYVALSSVPDVVELLPISDKSEICRKE